MAVPNPYRLASRQALILIVLSFPFSGSIAADPEYISTLAGTGVAGLNGDGLPARNTFLSLPQDGAFAPDGTFYFSDWNNHRIRRILADGTIQTVAGTGELGDGQDGLATEMRLNHPTHVSFDAQGRLLIACWHNSKVKRIDLTTGMGVNVAGTGARAYGGDGDLANLARLDLPSSVVVDSFGNLIISDQANFRLRKVDAANMIATSCGTGIAGYTGDDGLATLATIKSPVGQSAAPAGRIDIDVQDRIYIADTGNHAIRRIDTDGMIHTIAGTGIAGYSGDNGPATAAQLNTPSDVAVDPLGRVYIADTKNNVIRRIEIDGTIHTVAGTGIQGFSGDGGLAKNAKLNRPYGVAIGPDGEVVIADTHNQRLRILTEDPLPGGGPVEEEPVVIIPCTGEVGSICTYAGTGVSAFNGDGKDRQKTDLYWPFDMEFTPSGKIYVLDWNNHRVRRVMQDGTLQTVVGTDFVGDGPPGATDLIPPGAPGVTIDLNHPTDLQEFPDGDLMVMAWHNHKIRVLDPDTGLVQVIAGLGVGFVDNVPAKDARLNQPPRGVLDPNGNLIFIDQRNQRIRLIRDFAAQRANAMVSTIAGNPGSPVVPGYNGDGLALETKFNFPTGTNPEPTGGIARAPNGDFYFSDTLNHRIRRLRFAGPDFTDGSIVTIAGTGVGGYSGEGAASTAQVNYPQDVEIGPDGKLYFADANNNRIRRIDLTNDTIETIVGTGVEGYSGDGGPAIDATLNRPFGIAFDPHGNLYVSDTFNSRIRKVKLTTTPEGPDPILPADYSASFVEVRNCRFSLEHGGVYIRVLASTPEAAAEYQNNASPLPVGTVIVKEEYADDHCDSSELLRWRVMRKEAPGYDAPAGDWHWQWLTPRREVVYDNKDTCISCHLQPDCVVRDFMCAHPGNTSEMKVVLDDLPASLVSISGTPPDDGHSHGGGINFNVYAVGADPGDGRGPFVVGYSHEGEWRRYNTGATGDLWWISDHVIDGSFYMCGEDGLILRFDEVTKTFTRMETPGGKLLFGIWGTDAQHLWAVGGDLNDEDQGGVVWKFNGTEWAVDATVAEALPGGIPTLYKVWGRNVNDIWVCGRLGVVLQFNGARWTTVPTGVTRPLFTIHGNDTRVVATGGAFEGVLLELENEVFVNRTPPSSPQLNGVFISLGGPSAAVGAEGSFAVRGASGWELKAPVTAKYPADFHGTWMDSAGGIWAVGGDLSVDQSYGILAYAGAGTVARDWVADPCAPGISNFEIPQTVSYSRQIVQLFRQRNCLNPTCHGGAPVNPESEYDLRTYATSFGPGLQTRTFGMCDIVPGNPDASFLLDKLGPNPRVGAQMPDGFPPLSAADINLIRTWISEGAVDDTAPAGTFRRGDFDAGGTLNITDPIATFNYLFVSGLGPDCEDAADANDDGFVNITDGIFSLNFQFIGVASPAPPPPFPGCGFDTTQDELDCQSLTCK
jgi:sugar lactone lactonase YvrE